MKQTITNKLVQKSDEEKSELSNRKVKKAVKYQFLSL